MDNLPLISIGIPTKNRIDYLKEALGSVLCQSYENIQIVISDNASIDGTFEWVQSIKDERITFFRQEKDIGMVNNWNFCLENSMGSYFLLLSDDDILHFDAIKSLLMPFLKDNVSISYGNFIIFSNKSNIKKQILNKISVNEVYSLETGYEFTLNFFLGRREIYPCGILFRKSDLESIGNFSTKFQLAGDAFAWMSIVLRSEGLVSCVKNAYIGYRLHPESQTLLAKKNIWFNEVSHLHHFFENNFERSNFQSNSYDYRRYKFRNAVRISKYNSPNYCYFLRSFYFLILEMRPSIVEILQNLARWGFLDPIWSKVKKALKY
jgi:glycosyltransferase involved in cell wall biosynthesis